MRKFSIHEAITKRRILPFLDGPKIVSKEMLAAGEDLKDAEDSFSQGRFKWATIQAYYSMFHVSRALLYNKKYREKSHVQLCFAIKTLYVDEGLLSEEYYDNLTQAMALREMADYKRKFSQQGAERNIEAAKKSILMVEAVLKKKSGKY